MLAYDGSICCHLMLRTTQQSVSTGSQYSDNRNTQIVGLSEILIFWFSGSLISQSFLIVWYGLPTMLTIGVQAMAFFVISQIYSLDIWVFSIEVANCTVAVDAQVQLLCYPRGSFYPISPVPPTKYTRITRSDFRLCLTCKSHSQASLCPCTIIPISIRN